MKTARSGSTGFLNTITRRLRSVKQAASAIRKSSYGKASTRISYADYVLTAKDRLLYGAIAGGAAAGIVLLFYRSPAAALVLGPAAFVLYPLYKRKELGEKRLERLNLEFRDLIGILSGFLAAGYSVENAFYASEKELSRLYGKDSMIVQETAQINRGIRLNKPAELLISDFADRSGLQDVRSFAGVFLIAKRTGGDLRRIIDRTSEVIRDRIAVQEEIRTLTASRRLEQAIMNLIPFLLIFYISAAVPGYLDVMYETLPGRLVMTVCLILIAAAYLLQKKILEIQI